MIIFVVLFPHRKTIPEMYKNYRFIFLLTLLVYMYIGNSFAQDTIPSLSSKPQRPDNFWRRVSVGGNLGFQFGSVTGINISPEVRIRTIDQLHLGIRFIYQYYNYKNYYVDTRSGDYIDFSSSVYGGGLYLRYYLSSIFDSFLGNIFAHVEYEYLTYSLPFVQSPYPPYGNGYIWDGNQFYVPGKQTIRINSIFVGGGYRQPLSNRVSMDLMILFNLNDSYNSPYTNPIFRLGVGVGL